MTGQRSIGRSSQTAWPVSWTSSSFGISGFFHQAGGPNARSAVVVLCNPLGWEAIASQRGYRHLAERLARAGFPVLRFDYPGTGDSLSDDGDSEHVEAWLGGLQAAIEKARELSGKTEVSLAGVQMGATLALLAAQRRNGVASIAAWAPYGKGKTYVREVRAYRALNDGDPGYPRAEDQGGLEAAGFLLSASTLEALAKLDITASAVVPAPKVVIAGRDQSPPDPALTSYLQAAGAEVTLLKLDGYRDLMQEPRKSVVPDESFAQIVEQLCRFHPALPQPAASGAVQPPATLEWSSAQGVPLREEAITFGEGGGLFGVLCEPGAAATPATKKPAVLFLTTASHHRVGPNRMFVPLARELAARGFSTLRFDLTGVGDSPTVPGVIEGHAYSKSFVADVRSAMDHLQRTLGVEKFVTVGLCSGAYLGFHASLADPRVAGEVLINPQTFNWADGDSLEINQRVTFKSTRFYRLAVFESATWRRLFKGQINAAGIVRVVFDRLKTRFALEWKRTVQAYRTKALDGDVDVSEAFKSLLARGADILLIYAGNDEGLDHLSTQVGSRLRHIRKHAGFCLEIVDGADHTFTQIWAQKHLSKLIVDHLESKFGG